MSGKESILIKAISDMITNAFEMNVDEQVQEQIQELSSNILIKIKASMPKPKPVAASAATSKSSSGEKKKGNSYSHFVSVVANQVKGLGPYSDTIVTPIHRDKVTEKTAANIAENQSSISFDEEVSFSDFCAMITAFEAQGMKRSAIMWGLLSDDDRKKFAD
jgi:hypothetical protein